VHTYTLLKVWVTKPPSRFTPLKTEQIVNPIEYVSSDLCKKQSEYVTLVNIPEALLENEIVLHNLL